MVDLSSMEKIVKQTVKRILHAAGLQVTRTSVRRQTKAALIEHIFELGFRPGTVIDVGVENGTPELYGRFPGAALLLVEPLREFEHILRKICREDHLWTYIIAAAGATQGTVTLNVHQDMGASSTYRETEGAHVDGSPREVPVVTLNQLCNERGLPAPYLIKVDVQGAELTVLEGASKILADTELVVLEVSLFEFYIGGPQFYDVVCYMKERGFVVYDIIDGGNRPLDGALGQVDVAFVKENGIFRKHHIYSGPVIS